jgi:hypothetical protein
MNGSDENASGNTFFSFMKYALLALIVVVVLFFIVNFLLPMIGETEGSSETDNVEISVDLNEDGADNE